MNKDDAIEILNTAVYRCYDEGCMTEECFESCRKMIKQFGILSNETDVKFIDDLWIEE